MQNNSFTGTMWGYVRVSTKEQKLDRQIDAMLDYGIPVSHIWEDKETSKNFNRPEYKKMLKVAQRGDIIVIKSIDRLGRNYTEIRDQWALITQDIGCGIHVIDMPALNTTGEINDLNSRFMTDLILQVLAFVAQNERDTILKHQREGIASAHKNRKNPGGRPKASIPYEFWEIFILWKSGEVRTKELLAMCKEEYGMSTRSFYRRMRELDQRYGDIPPDKLRMYIVEDDFANGIEFSMERCEDMIDYFNPYRPNRKQLEVSRLKKHGTGYHDIEPLLSSKDLQKTAEEEEIRKIILEKRQEEFRKYFHLDDGIPHYAKHGKKLITTAPITDKDLTKSDIKVESIRSKSAVKNVYHGLDARSAGTFL